MSLFKEVSVGCWFISKNVRVDNENGYHYNVAAFLKYKA